MKKLKYLLTMFCLILMPKVVKAEMHLICPNNVIGGNTLSCALEVTDKYKSVSGTLDVPSTIKYVGIYGGTYTNLSAENGLYLRNDKLVGADIIGYLHFDTQEVANNTTIEIIIKSSSYVYSDDTKSAETDIKRLVTLTPKPTTTTAVTKEEFYAGGNSDPRNPNILKMFGFVNVGERAGSGVDKIMTAWAEQNWKKPEFDFSERNERVTLNLEVGQVVYIPGAADIRNTVEKSEAETITTMSKEDKVLAYIRQNGSISMQKVVESCNYRSRTGARKLIDKMINADLIEKIGKGNNTIYKIKE